VMEIVKDVEKRSFDVFGRTSLRVSDTQSSFKREDRIISRSSQNNNWSLLSKELLPPNLLSLSPLKTSLNRTLSTMPSCAYCLLNSVKIQVLFPVLFCRFKWKKWCLSWDTREPKSSRIPFEQSRMTDKLLYLSLSLTLDCRVAWHVISILFLCLCTEFERWTVLFCQTDIQT
jgi:hypothetical protein